MNSIAIIVLFGLTYQSPSTQVAETAEAYVKAVEAMDWVVMKSLLTEASIFEDPTSDLFGDPWRYEGAEAIVAFYSHAARDTLSTQYRILRQFVSGNRAVYVFEVVVRVKGTMIGFPDEIIEDKMQGVTVLTVRNGKIAHHIDYVDYADMLERLALHRQNLEAKAEAHP